MFNKFIMINLKNLRRPSFAVTLALITLFISCSPNNDVVDIDEENITLQEFISKHKEITFKYTSLSNTIPLEDFVTLDIDDTEAYEELKKSNLDVPDELLTLQKELVENTTKLLNNPYFKDLSQDEIIEIVRFEIENSFRKNNNQKNGDPCHDLFNSMNDDCLTEFAASMAVATVVGIFTSFGAGTVIAGGIALVRFSECNKAAQAAADNCRN